MDPTPKEILGGKTEWREKIEVDLHQKKVDLDQKKFTLDLRSWPQSSPPTTTTTTTLTVLWPVGFAAGKNTY